MEIEMKIKGLVVDPISKMPIVVLEDPMSDQILPIWIGVFEANAIALTIENIPTPRPMTHDLIKNFLNKLSISLDRVVVNDVRNNTFYATIHCRYLNEELLIDSRPSDAIALALRMNSPIFVRGRQAAVVPGHAAPGVVEAALPVVAEAFFESQVQAPVLSLR